MYNDILFNLYERLDTSTMYDDGVDVPPFIQNCKKQEEMQVGGDDEEPDGEYKNLEEKQKIIMEQVSARMKSVRFLEDEVENTDIIFEEKEKEHLNGIDKQQDSILVIIHANKNKDIDKTIDSIIEQKQNTSLVIALDKYCDSEVISKCILKFRNHKNITITKTQSNNAVYEIISILEASNYMYDYLIVNNEYNIMRNNQIQMLLNKTKNTNVAIIKDMNCMFYSKELLMADDIKNIILYTNIKKSLREFNLKFVNNNSYFTITFDKIMQFIDRLREKFISAITLGKIKEV